MITIRTRLTLVVVFATVAGAIIGWLLRQHTLLSFAFVGGVAAAAIGTVVMSRLLVTDPATSILQAVSDGLLSFTEREYGMRLAAPDADEVLGDLVRRFNKLGEALRTEHNDRYQREILLETVLETTAMAVVLCNEALRIVYANGAARDLFGGGRKLDGQDFHAILAAAPPAFRQAIEQETDTIFSVEKAETGDGGAEAGPAAAPETYHLARRYFQLSMQPHILFILKPLTRAILRKEADTWKRTIRVISHEINNSLAPISSLIHSGRLMLQKPEMVPRLAEALDTIEERSAHLRGFIEGYAKFARLPMPAKQESRWDALVESLRPLYSFQV
ncbi:MAG TPA: PAS domain-containing protein, partial [Polyangia bacterium]|nr:PAS domain-containing protein [Polyangia bacterium]